MRGIAGALALMVATSATVAAQSMEEKYKKKLEKGFTSKIDWTQNLEKAREEAVAKEKLIFGYCSRSYAQ